MALLEQVGSAVRILDFVADGVSERYFGDLIRVGRLLIPKS